MTRKSAERSLYKPQASTRTRVAVTVISCLSYKEIGRKHLLEGKSREYVRSVVVAHSGLVTSLLPGYMV